MILSNPQVQSYKLLLKGRVEGLMTGCKKNNAGERRVTKLATAYCMKVILTIVMKNTRESSDRCFWFIAELNAIVDVRNIILHRVDKLHRLADVRRLRLAGQRHVTDDVT